MKLGWAGTHDINRDISSPTMRIPLWSDMYVTDPACTVALMTVCCCCDEYIEDEGDEYDEVSFSVHDRKGIKMGLVERLSKEVWANLKAQSKERGASEVWLSASVEFSVDSVRGYVGRQ